MIESITPTQRLMMAHWVREILGTEKAPIWWQTENPLLGGVKPWHMTLNERTEAKLYRFIENAFENNRAADQLSEQRR